MPTYAFKCDTCGNVDHEVVMTMSDYVEWFDCGFLPDCGGIMRRWYAGTAPAVGKIDGAGRSPIRGAL